MELFAVGVEQLTSSGLEIYNGISGDIQGVITEQACVSLCTVFAQGKLPALGCISATDILPETQGSESQ